MSGKDRRNRCVFSLEQKTGSDGADCTSSLIRQRVPNSGRSNTKGTTAYGSKTVSRHLQPTGCRRPKAAATGEVSRTLQNVQVRRSSTMEDAICSDGKPIVDALGDAEPVQHRQCVGHVIVPP